MRTLKIFSVLLLTLGLLMLMGSSSVLMASHGTHLATGGKGPELRQDGTGCLTCHAPGTLQCGEEAPLFNDDKPLATTTVCNPCHSLTGVAMAKEYWDTGVYNVAGDSLMVEGWCDTCHDDAPSTIRGVPAPNVMGDDTNYGYSVSGHGRSDINKKCEHCHDLQLRHIDGVARTYDASTGNYMTGYRLNADMSIPRYSPDTGEDAFRLCFNCHEFADVLDVIGGNQSNFRDDDEGEYYHDQHLLHSSVTNNWDSDVDGSADSLESCPACHNVHGSRMVIDSTPYPNPKMIRDGSLVGHPSGFDFLWYDAPAWDLNKQPTPNFEDSLSGRMLVGDNVPYNGICGQPGCHAGQGSYTRTTGHTAGSIQIMTIGVTEKIYQTFPPLYPGQTARIWVKFCVFGPTGTTYLVKSPGTVSKVTGANWEKKLKFEEHYPAQGYHDHNYYWYKEIPYDATAPDSVQVKVKLKLYDEWGLELLDTDTYTRYFDVVPYP